MPQCFAVTEQCLHSVCDQIYTQGVMLEAMLLQPNMVLPGLNRPQQETAEAVAAATVRCFLRAVPAAVPGVMLLSGGLSAKLAAGRLSAMRGGFKSTLTP